MARAIDVLLGGRRASCLSAVSARELLGGEIDPVRRQTRRSLPGVRLWRPLTQGRHHFVAECLDERHQILPHVVQIDAVEAERRVPA